MGNRSLCKVEKKVNCGEITVQTAIVMPGLLPVNTLWALLGGGGFLMSEGGGGGGDSWLAAFSLGAPPPSPPVLGPGGFPEHIMDFHFPVMLLSINGPRIYLFSNESRSLLLGENLPMYLVEFGTNEQVKSHTNAEKSARGKGSDSEISRDYCRSPEIPEWSRTYPTFFSHPQKKTCTSRF